MLLTTIIAQFAVGYNETLFGERSEVKSWDIAKLIKDRANEMKKE